MIADSRRQASSCERANRSASTDGLISPAMRDGSGRVAAPGFSIGGYASGAKGSEGGIGVLDAREQHSDLDGAPEVARMRSGYFESVGRGERDMGARGARMPRDVDAVGTDCHFLTQGPQSGIRTRLAKRHAPQSPKAMERVRIWPADWEDRPEGQGVPITS